MVAIVPLRAAFPTPRLASQAAYHRPDRESAARTQSGGPRSGADEGGSDEANENRMVSAGGADAGLAAGGPGPVERAPVRPDTADRSGSADRESGDAAGHHAVRPVDAVRDADSGGPAQG